MSDQKSDSGQPQVGSDGVLGQAEVMAAIDAEEELTGDMPNHMWEAINGDRDATTQLLRIVVRQTKAGIAKRLGLQSPNVQMQTTPESKPK